MHMQHDWSVPLEKHLVAFVAITEEGGFTKAAAALGISQPQLSRRLRALEADVGEPLIDRRQRRVKLTFAGSALLAPAKQLLAGVDAFTAVARARSSSGTLRVAVPADRERRYPVRLMRAAAQHQLTLELRVDDAGERAEALANREVDAAVVRVWPQLAEMVAPIGIAARQLPSVAERRELTLGDFRPGGGGVGHRAILVTVEDSDVESLAAVEQTALRCGLVPGQVVSHLPTTAACVRALCSDDAVLCTRTLGRGRGLQWAPLADVGVRRSYRLEAQGGDPRVDVLRGPLAALFANAIGAQLVERQRVRVR